MGKRVVGIGESTLRDAGRHRRPQDDDALLATGQWVIQNGVQVFVCNCAQQHQHKRVFGATVHHGSGCCKKDR